MGLGISVEGTSCVFHLLAISHFSITVTISGLFAHPSYTDDSILSASDIMKKSFLCVLYIALIYE